MGVTLDRKFRSILDELNDYVPERSRDLLIENRAVQVIASVGHLVNLIKESYSEEDADDLIKRLFNAARTSDEGKFTRKMKAIRESHQPSRGDL